MWSVLRGLRWAAMSSVMSDAAVLAEVVDRGVGVEGVAEHDDVEGEAERASWSSMASR
jgi:hypothetical protein